MSGTCAQWVVVSFSENLPGNTYCLDAWEEKSEKCVSSFERSHYLAVNQSIRVKEVSARRDVCAKLCEDMRVYIDSGS